MLKRSESFSARRASLQVLDRWVGPEQLDGFGRRSYSGRLSFWKRSASFRTRHGAAIR